MTSGILSFTRVGKPKLLLHKYLSTQMPLPPNPKDDESKSIKLPVTLGEFQALGEKYGKFFIIYYSSLWLSTGIASYGAVSLFGPDAVIQVLGQVLPKSMAITTQDPIILTYCINEFLEPIRLPFALLTMKPVHERYSTLMNRKKDGEKNK
jgi:hypothetical protein